MPRWAAISIKIVLTLCFHPNLFSPSPRFERHQMFVKPPLSRMTGALAWKELIGLIRCLDFSLAAAYPVWCYVPGNARVQQTRGWNRWQAGLWHPDMGYRGCCGYWSTWAETAQRANVLILTRSGEICLLVWIHKVHLLLKKLSKLDLWNKDTEIGMDIMIKSFLKIVLILKRGKHISACIIVQKI